jgi:hypothetical protein
VGGRGVRGRGGRGDRRPGADPENPYASWRSARAATGVARSWPAGGRGWGTVEIIDTQAGVNLLVEATGSQLVLGRSSNDVDLVTRFMPADPASDNKSAGLSRKQARFSVNAAGLLTVENISSGNVVIVGRSAVPVGGSSLLSSDQALSLGTPPADLRLHVRLAPAPGHSIRLANLEEWQGYGPSRHLPADPEATWGHAMIDWLNSAPSYWQTIWFSRLAAFGSASDVPLRLVDSGLDPCHGFLHYFSGCYWLEVISQRGGVTLHDPQNPETHAAVPIPPGVIVPLRGNMTLTLGNTSFLLTKAA